MAVIYMIQLDTNNNIHPRFIHVLLDESVRRTKEAYKFIKLTFQHIKDRGFNDCVAVIPLWKDNMINFAERFGFVNYTNDDKYKYYIKQLS